MKVDWSKATVSATPRRLFVLIPDFPLKQEPAVTEIKGPPAKTAFKAGKPTKAAEGFAKSKGLKVSDLIIKKTPQGKYVYGIKKEEGTVSRIALEKNLPSLIKSIAFKKSMRWQNNLTFVRPIRWICCMLGKTTLNFELDGLKSGKVTYGHRLLANQKIALLDADKYLQSLKKAKVLIPSQARAKIIRNQLDNEAKKVRGKIDWGDPRINQTFEEVVNLVEWPSTLAGKFEKEFLVLPDVVIKTVLQSHQRYFPVINTSGLMPFFLVVQNGNPNKKQLVKEGHERVVKARLADGKFFFEEDIKIPLEDRIGRLQGITFHEKLGTVFDKQERIKDTGLKLVKKLSLSEKVSVKVKRAASLLKTDLTTSMVGEFAELQGAIGREYALVERLDKDTANAILEHYLPRFAGDYLPKTKLGALMSVADKTDSIVAHYAIGNIPTSAGDPFGLRRLANGLVSVLIEHSFFISIEELTATAYKSISKQTKEIAGENQVIKQITGFMLGRLEKALSSQGIDYDIIRSLSGLQAPNIADIKLRAAALSELRKKPAFDNLLTSFNRCLNLGQVKAGLDINNKLLIEGEEKAFFEKLKKVEDSNKQLLKQRKYLDSLSNLAGLRGVIDIFFDNVLVMAEDKKIRKNRLSLLNRFVNDCKQIADLSEIVVPG